MLIIVFIIHSAKSKMSFEFKAKMIYLNYVKYSNRIKILVNN